MAPTGVSAINIALAISKQAGGNLPAMSDQKKTQMRVSLSELKLIIIYEISMVSNITLKAGFHYHGTKARVALWTSSVLISPNSVKILSSLNRPSAT